MSESRSRGKVGSSNEQGSMKKNACMSVWSEEDDVSLMQGMIDYEEQKQASPYDDLGKFLDFVKPRVHFDVQRKQLTDKLWKLRNKFVNSSYNLSKAHHAKLFELAKLIQSWGHGENVGLDCGKGENVGSGDDGNGGKEKKSKVGRNKQRGELVVDGGLNGEKGNVGVDGDVCVNKEIDGISGVVKGRKSSKDLEELTCMYPQLIKGLKLETLSRMPQNLKDNCVVDTINFMGKEKANELEEKWTDLRVMELGLQAKKLDLAKTHINLIFEAARR
ncbi:hypothetical protein ACET3Z_013122 [Daucus carota]